MSWLEDNSAALLCAVVVLLLLITFNEQISYLLSAVKTTVVSMLTGAEALPCGCHGKCTCNNMPDDDDKTEHLSDPVIDASNPVSVRGGGSDVLDALGYSAGGDMAWDEVVKVSDLDPSVHRNHQNFVADVRRFSSGANFTAVNDDNTNSAFTNFVGLRRPQHVDILPDARQQPDIDQDVLQRNKPLIW